MSSRPAAVPVVRALRGPAAYMCGLAWDGKHLWHSDQEAGRIYALDSETGQVRHSIACDRVRADLTWRDDVLYQVGGRPKRLVMVQPDSGEILGERPVLPASGRLTGLEVGDEGFWMCLRAPTVVQFRDHQTLSVQLEIPVPGSPSGLTLADGLVVYADFEAALVRVANPVSGELLAAAFVEGKPTGMTWDGELLWYCDFASRSVKAIRLDDVLARVVR